MILVSVGTHNKGFDRLVQAMDALAGEIDERVIIQRGATAWQPQHAAGFTFMSGEDMAQLTAEARVIVTHAAAGSAMLAISLGKPLVLVPRLQRFDEHMDDHQVQLAQALNALGRAVAVYEPTPATLREAIERAPQYCTPLSGPERLIDAVRSQINGWEPARTRIQPTFTGRG